MPYIKLAGFKRWLFVLLATLLANALFISSTSAATGGGWKDGTDPNTIYATPDAACDAQHARYGGPGESYGAHFSGGGSEVAGCEWEYVFGYSRPASAFFYCPAGTYMVPQTSECRIDDTARSSCDQQSAHPIDVLTGAKLFYANDFSTEDHTLELNRIYVSRPFGGLGFSDVNSFNASLGNWFSFFDVQIQFAESWDYYQIATVLFPDGTAVRFQRQSNGTMAPYADGNLPLTDKSAKLFFVGKWPANPTSINGAVSVWQLVDKENNIWTLQTQDDQGLRAFRVAKPVSVQRPDGTVLTFTYDQYQALTAISDQNGKSLQVTWNRKKFMNVLAVVGYGPQSVTKITLPGGYSVIYAYETLDGVSSTNATDRLVRVDLVDNAGVVQDRTTYQYGNPSYPKLVTGVLDRNNVLRWKVTYDDEGRAIRSESPNGEEADSIAYAPIGDTFTRTQTDALNRQTVYTFKRTGWSTRLTAVEGLQTTNCPYANAQSTYDDAGNLTSATDQEGRVVTYAPDALGRPTQIVEASGTPTARTTLVSWHSLFNLPLQVARVGRTDTFVYDATARLTKYTQTDTTTQTTPYATKGQQRTWTVTYGTAGGARGKITSINEPLPGSSDIKSYAYNANGYLAAQQDEVGHVTTITAWDWRGAPLTVVDSNGVATNFTYDIRGRILSATVNPGANQEKYTFSYDAVGNLSQMTLPTGGYLQYVYDAASRLTKVSNEKGETVSLTPNPFGRPTTVVIKAASGGITEQRAFVYDELNRLIRTLGGASVTSTDFGYDRLGNLITLTDGRGKTSTTTVDALNRVTAKTNPDNEIIAKTYDAYDKMTSFQDGRHLTTRFIRNGFGEVIEEVSPDRGTTDYWRDNAGNIIKTVEADGQVTTMTYDGAGRMLVKAFANATPEKMTFAYDDTSSDNKGMTRLTKVTEASGSTALTYDAFGNLVTSTKTIQGKRYVTGYLYDAAGHVVQQQLPSGRLINFARNSSEQITAITTTPKAGAAASAIVSSVTYRPFGPVKSLTFGNGLPLAQTYNANGWLTRTQVGSGSAIKLDLSYKYFDDGRLSAITDNAATGRSVQIALTNSGRLAGANGPWGNETFGYDAAGNRTAEKLVVGKTTTADNQLIDTASNRLIQTTDTNGVAKRTFVFYPGGNLATDAAGGVAYTYAYNARKRLSQVRFGSALTGEYGYDYNEERVWRKSYGLATTTTHYIFDEAGHLLAEHNGTTGGVVREYIWLDDTLVGEIDSSIASPQTLFVHTGRLKEPEEMTDVTGAKVWDAVMSPFGSVKIFGAGKAQLDLRLPGQWFEAEAGASGLSQNWHRNYDYNIGRYTEVDPMGITVDSNLYAYVSSQPYDAFDNGGLLKITDQMPSQMPGTASCPSVEPKYMCTKVNWQRENPIGEWLFHGGANVYKEPHAPGTWGAECVYDDGRLIKSGPDAGTADFFPDDDYIDHAFIDPGGPRVFPTIYAIYWLWNKTPIGVQ